MTNPPNPDPSAKPNWMNEVFTLRAMSGFRGARVTRYSCWAGEILHVANIKIIKTKIKTNRLTPARANKSSVVPCNRSPRQMVNFDPFASASCPPSFDPTKLQMPARNRTPLISVMEREDVACKKGVI
ncbi:hypothetical protein D3C76_1110980 [compost metagenome]